MKEKREVARTIGLCLLAVYLAFAWSCESRNKYAGVYVAIKGEPQQEKISFQLKPNGEGTWIVGDKDIFFSWYIKKGDLRINTKEGGVLVGKFVGNRIRISLPIQCGEMLFEKTR